MKTEINKLIELEQSKLCNDASVLTKEAEAINIDIAINDYEDIEELEKTIKMMARIRKLKVINNGL